MPQQHDHVNSAQFEIDNLNPFALLSAWKSNLNKYLIASSKLKGIQYRNKESARWKSGKQRNVNINISRMQDDTNIFLDDPWTHWLDKQDGSIRKAPIALGISEHIISSKLCRFCRWNFDNNYGRSGVQLCSFKNRENRIETRFAILLRINCVSIADFSGKAWQAWFFFWNCPTGI